MIPEFPFRFELQPNLATTLLHRALGDGSELLPEGRHGAASTDRGLTVVRYDPADGLVTGEGRGEPLGKAVAPQIGDMAWPENEPVPLLELLRSRRDAALLLEPPLALPVGDVAMLFGDGGVGKSWLAMQLAVSVAAGRAFLGTQPQRGSVLWLDFESPAAELGRRVASLLAALQVDPLELDGTLHVQPYSQSGKSLASLQEQVHEVIEQTQPALIVVDGWQAAFGGDPVDAGHVTGCYRVLRGLAARGAAVLVLHHVSTTQMKTRSPNPAGSRWVQHFTRGAYRLTASAKGGTDVSLELVKDNYGVRFDKVQLRKVEKAGGLFFDVRPAFVIDVPASMSEFEDRRSERYRQEFIWEFLGRTGGKARVTLLYVAWAAKFKLSTRTAKRDLKDALEKLVAVGRLVMKPEGNTHTLEHAV